MSIAPNLFNIEGLKKHPLQVSIYSLPLVVKKGSGKTVNLFPAGNRFHRSFKFKSVPFEPSSFAERRLRAKDAHTR